MRSTTLVSSLALFTALSTAWPWPPSWQAAQQEKRQIASPWQKRQNNNDASSSFDLNFGGTQGNTATTDQQTTTDRNNNNDPTVSSSASLPASSSDSGNTRDGNGNGNGGTTDRNSDNTDDSTKKTTKYETTKTFDARLPAGGLSMITPNAILGPKYYKIEDYVTFAWNYTSLKITPTAVDILASCSDNSATYTIAANASVTGATQAVTWDTNQYYETPLLMATYTLVVYDAASEVTAMPRAGYLGTYDQFTFGMYIPQKYTPIADYVCATCNGANSLTKHTAGFLAGMVVLTVVSFGWFTGVAGLW
jgi:hypothetical protein